MINKIINKLISFIPGMQVALYDLFTVYKFRKFDHVKRIKKVFKDMEKNGYKFSGWALSKASLLNFCFYLFLDKEQKNIVELGGGSSTVFWHNLSKNKIIKFKLFTMEHDLFWIDKIKKEIDFDDNIVINYSKLKQISDNERYELFSKPSSALDLYTRIGIERENENKNTRAKNIFYNINYDTIIPDKIDGLIVDGPHGDGRSLAFPLFFKNLRKDSLVLIDDFDHYPFLEDLGKVFDYKVIIKFKAVLNGKRWILVKII